MEIQKPVHGRKFVANDFVVIPSLNPPADGTLEYWVVAKHGTLNGRVLKLAVFRGGKFPETRARKLAAILNAHLAQLSVLLPDFVFSFNIDMDRLNQPLTDVQKGKGRVPTTPEDIRTPLIDESRL